LLWLGEQLFLIGRNGRIVFHRSLEELKQRTKKSRFSQIRQRIKLILLAKPKLPGHLIPKPVAAPKCLEGLPPFLGSI
jgi:hypothetical protein